MTSCHPASHVLCLQMCKVLLEIGANMNLYNKAGITSFSSACLHGEAATVAFMLQLGADVNGGSQQPLYLACKGGVGRQLYRYACFWRGGCSRVCGCGCRGGGEPLCMACKGGVGKQLYRSVDGVCVCVGGGGTGVGYCMCGGQGGGLCVKLLLDWQGRWGQQPLYLACKGCVGKQLYRSVHGVWEGIGGVWICGGGGCVEVRMSRGAGMSVGWGCAGE